MVFAAGAQGGVTHISHTNPVGRQVSAAGERTPQLLEPLLVLALRPPQAVPVLPTPAAPAQPSRNRTGR